MGDNRESHATCLPIPPPLPPSSSSSSQSDNTNTHHQSEESTNSDQSADSSIRATFSLSQSEVNESTSISTFSGCEKFSSNQVQGSRKRNHDLDCFPSKKRYKPKKKFKIPHLANPNKNKYVGESSYRFHYGQSPVDMVRAARQYMYDMDGNEFLDCISVQVPAGHCHSQVVLAAQNQMGTLAASFGFMHQLLPAFIKKIVETLPSPLCVAYLLNSGSEANDLALRLAQSYTNGRDVICMEGSYHGGTSATVEVSAKNFWKLPHGKKDHVHVLRSPETYRRNDDDGDEDSASSTMTNRAKTYIENVARSGRRISCFIGEALMSHAGMTVPPPGYLAAVYDAVRLAGGVCIADEVQIGLGRVGEHFWAFQTHEGIVPDIVTVGKPLGNGHPVAAVITTAAIADSCVEFSSTFGGNPVSCAIGLTLLEVMRNEKLLISTAQVGKRLKDQLVEMMHRRRHIGDVRGLGLAIGVEIVVDRVSKKPWRRLAEELMYKMKEKKILVATKGLAGNVVTITPPLCFTLDNAKTLVKVMDELLEDIEANIAKVEEDDSNSNSNSDIFYVDGFDASDSDSEEDERVGMVSNYEDMD